MAGPDDTPGDPAAAPGDPPAVPPGDSGDPTDRRPAIIAVAVALLVVAAIAVFALTRSPAEDVTTGGTAGTGTGTTSPGTTGATTTAPETTTTAPGAATTAPPGGATTTVAPDPGPTACAAGAPVPPPAPEPTDALRDSVRAALVGCPEADVETRAAAAGWSTRVVRRDGEDLPATMDYRPDRLNLAVENGTVTDLDIG